MADRDENLTPGEMLAAARTKAELTLEEVADNTKIPLNMLRAIEMDEYHRVSGDLYVKSFLRAYGSEVGLEPEELIEIYETFTGATSAAAESAVAGAWNENDVEIKRVGLPWDWIGAGLFLVAVVIGGYFWLDDKESIPEEKILLNTETMEVLDQSGEVSIPSVIPAADPETNPVTTPDSAQDSTQISTVGNSVESTPDTLAPGWSISLATNEPLKGTNVVFQEDKEIPINVSTISLPNVHPCDPSLVFDNDKQWPYVIRLICPEPGVFSVRRDAEAGFSKAIFPNEDETEEWVLPEQPAAGQAYSSAQGFVVYWGADDHFSIELGLLDGVELTFNGLVQDLRPFASGQTILLDPILLRKAAGN
ncbi:MAG: hypothetical protein GY780_08390 [bacterium]|nr:hypothetical protein [bacterium]